MVTWERAASLEGEYQHLARVVEDIVGDAPRHEYAEWLRAQGDHLRADKLVELGVAHQTLTESALPDLRELPAAWCDLVGATLLEGIVMHQLQPYCERILLLARPSVSFTWQPAADREFSVGSSKLWGLPDLPGGTAWPSRGSCLHWDDDCDIDPAAPCAFLGQFSLADLAGTAAARLLPQTGLLSFFAHTECEQFGTVSVRAIHSANLDTLVRFDRPANIDDEVNAPRPPHTLAMREVLALPDPGGPWASDLGFASEDDADRYRAMLEARGNQLFGLLGYLQSTTGGDPTPDQSYCKLACLPTDPEAGIVHLMLTSENLEAGHLDEIEFAWLDWDG